MGFMEYLMDISISYRIDGLLMVSYYLINNRWVLLIIYDVNSCWSIMIFNGHSNGWWWLIMIIHNDHIYTNWLAPSIGTAQSFPAKWTLQHHLLPYGSYTVVWKEHLYLSILCNSLHAVCVCVFDIVWLCFESKSSSLKSYPPFKNFAKLCTGLVQSGSRKV